MDDQETQLAPEAIANLRWQIARSRRRQELYLDVIGDCALCAAQQVQDKRIELLERGPEFSASQLFLTFLLNLALGGVGGTLGQAGLKKVLGRMLTPVVATRASVSITKGRRVIVVRTPSKTMIKEASVVVVKGPISPAPGKTHALFHEFPLKSAEIALDTLRGEAVAQATAKPEPPENEVGADSPGVAIQDSAFAFVRTQKSAMHLTHDIHDIRAAAGLVDEDVFNATMELMLRNLEIPEKTDLSDTRRKMILLFEATIWASMFPRNSWGIDPATSPEALDLDTTIGGQVRERWRPARTRMPGSEDLHRYWMARFQPLLDSPSEAALIQLMHDIIAENPHRFVRLEREGRPIQDAATP